MTKGSTEWYNAMAKKLNHHVLGMKATNAIPRFKKAMFITELSCMIAGKYSSGNNKEINEASVMSKNLMNLALKDLMNIKEQYLKS